MNILKQTNADNSVARDFKECENINQFFINKYVFWLSFLHQSIKLFFLSAIVFLFLCPPTFAAGDVYRSALIRAADYLVSTQDVFGWWNKKPGDVYGQGTAPATANAILSLLEAYKLTGNCSYYEAADKGGVNLVNDFIDSNGDFDYSAGGNFPSGFQRMNYLSSILPAWVELFNTMEFPLTGGTYYNSAVAMGDWLLSSGARITSSSSNYQNLFCWYVRDSNCDGSNYLSYGPEQLYGLTKLYEITGDNKYLTAAEDAASKELKYQYGSWYSTKSTVRTWLANDGTTFTDPEWDTVWSKLKGFWSHTYNHGGTPETDANAEVNIWTQYGSTKILAYAELYLVTADTTYKDAVISFANWAVNSGVQHTDGWFYIHLGLDTSWNWTDQYHGHPAVVRPTSWASNALLQAYQITGNSTYFDAGKTAADWLLVHNPPFNRNTGEVYRYQDGTGEVYTYYSQIPFQYLMKPMVDSGEGICSDSAKFNDFSANPVHAPTNRAYKPCVIYNSDSFCGYGDAAMYKMYYAKKDSSGYFIGYSTSDDGFIWTGDAAAGLGYGKTWPRIVFDSSGFSGTTNYYKMWYSDLSTTPYSIGYAYSSDGKIWTDYGIVINGPSEGENMFDFCVLYQPDGDTSGNDYANYKYIGYGSKTETVTFFYSPDGINWTNYGELTNQALNASVIRLADNNWKMWASASGAAAGSNNIRIDYYTSTDGLNWTAVSQPVPNVGSLGVAGSWNEICNYAPWVVYTGTTLRMWRSGKSSAGNYSVGVTNDYLTFDLITSDSNSDSTSAIYTMTNTNPDGTCDDFSPVKITIPAGYSVNISDYSTTGDSYASGTLDTLSGGIGSSGNTLSLATIAVDHSLSIISSLWGNIGTVNIIDPNDISDGSFTFNFNSGYELQPDTIQVIAWNNGVLKNPSVCQDYKFSGTATGYSSGDSPMYPRSGQTQVISINGTSPPQFDGLQEVHENKGLESATLSWKLPSGSCSGALTYHIYRSSIDCASIDYGTIISSTTDLTYTDNELTVGNTYYYVVRVEDFFHNEDNNTHCLSVVITKNATVADCNGWNDIGSIYSPGKAYYPSVIYDGTASFSGHGDAFKYKMWYSSSTGPALAVSDDGRNWTLYSSLSGLTNPHHIQVEYDSAGFGNSGYYYKIWYWNTALLYTISAMRTAESVDGVNWENDQALTQDASSVVNSSSSVWNRGTYGPVEIIYTASGSAAIDNINIMNNKYVMYYDGTTGGQEAIGLAYSVDGIMWYGYNGGLSPVLDVGASGEWDENYVTFGTALKNPDGFYEMWYSGGTNRAHEGIGYATSNDGLVWVKCANNPIQSIGGGANQGGLCPSGTWCETRNYTPEVIYDANAFGEPAPCQSKYKMWRSGKSAAGVYSIGQAVSDLTGSYYDPVSDVGNTLFADKSISSPFDVDFTWTVVPDAHHYHIYRGTDPDFTTNPPTLVKKSYSDEDAGKPGWQCTVGSNFGNIYFFKVYAANECDGESNN